MSQADGYSLRRAQSAPWLSASIDGEFSGSDPAGKAPITPALDVYQVPFHALSDGRRIPLNSRQTGVDLACFHPGDR